MCRNAIFKNAILNRGFYYFDAVQKVTHSFKVQSGNNHRAALFTSVNLKNQFRLSLVVRKLRVALRASRFLVGLQG